MVSLSCSGWGNYWNDKDIRKHHEHTPSEWNINTKRTSKWRFWIIREFVHVYVCYSAVKSNAPDDGISPLDQRLTLKRKIICKMVVWTCVPIHRAQTSIGGMWENDCSTLRHFCACHNYFHRYLSLAVACTNTVKLAASSFVRRSVDMKRIQGLFMYGYFDCWCKTICFPIKLRSPIHWQYQY